MKAVLLMFISLLPKSCLLCQTGPRSAVCKVQPDPRSSQPVTGVVTFYEENEAASLHINVTLSGFNTLPADANESLYLHGFHVHTFGNTTGNCDSTGSHYNPENVTHGAPDDLIRHAGDLGNIRQNLDGTLEQEFKDDVATLFGTTSIIGRSIVVHSGRDDLGKGGDAGSLATGNAGSRLACCVIEQA